MTKKERAAAVTELLKSVYPEAVCALHYTHDYELLFATRLSAQCTDARVNIVTEKLFKQFPTLQSFADASEEEIAEAEGQISDLIERWNVRDFDLRRVRATATIIDKKEEKGS